MSLPGNWLIGVSSICKLDSNWLCDVPNLACTFGLNLSFFGKCTDISTFSRQTLDGYKTVCLKTADVNITGREGGT